jgi:hypothetical protein
LEVRHELGEHAFKALTTLEQNRSAPSRREEGANRGRESMEELTNETHELESRSRVVRAPELTNPVTSGAFRIGRVILQEA